MIVGLGAGAGALLAPPALPALPPIPATPTVRVVIVRADDSAPGRVVLIVRIESSGFVLGSYQGQLRFNPAALSVDSSAAMRDGSRFVNAADASRGIVRFAGFTTSGFTGTDAMRVVARATGPLDGAHLVAVLDVAGDLDGKPVPKAALIAASGLAKP